MANVSVERFRKLTDELKREVLDVAVKELNTQGDSLVDTMKSVVAVDEGDLRGSIRKLPGKKPTQIRIVAGGPSTMRSGAGGRPYDHARAIEFGTRDMKAEPFFFPSYRLRKKKMISSMKRKLTASIKKRSAE